jgi:lysophospholipase L1-like esterase
MHIVSATGQTWSVDDHWTTSATWTAGPFTETRTIAVPAALTAGTYDIRVGLSGGSPWTDRTLIMGSGVTDPAADHRYKVGTLTVGAAGAPQITSTPVTTAIVGVAYSYDVNATDPNGDTLAYSLTQAPTGMTINATSGLIAWTPTASQTGAQAATVRATDTGGLFAAQSFSITVAAASGAPQITSTPVTSATAGVAYSYDVNATDPNGDTLTYSLTQAPTGMTISSSTGLIAWTPTAGQTGSQAVTVRATDTGGLFAAQTFTVTVTVAGANVAPQIGNSWRIMPVGDSNTENLSTFPGYQTITQALSAIGKSSAVFGYVNPGEPNIVKQVTTAQIGRSGWSTTDIISQINGWVDQVIPDIVLLNIGVNDGYFPNDLAAQDAVVSRIATIIDMIHARNPRTAVLVSNFERASDPMPTMYSKIQQMVLARAPVEPSIYFNVFFVPSLTGVLSSMYVSDGLHPNESGRLIIMNNWMNAVRSYVQTGTVPPPATSTAPLTTRVDLATPSAYYALPGSKVDINLNWYRMPMSANLVQFMHLDLNGSIAASVDDHTTTSATWTPGLFSETRTITAPTTPGTYDIRVGLSGGNPWADFVLITGVGVLDETNSRRYKVGTLTVP